MAQKPGLPGRPAYPGDVAPLAGYCVAVATDRRRHPMAERLETLGARTANVQALRTFAQADKVILQRRTEQVLAAPVDEVVVSSAFGLDAWLTAAAGWGHADALRAHFGEARLLARDARAADSLRAIGLSDIWSTASSAEGDLLRYLAAQPLTGRRIVVQQDAPSLREPCWKLRTLGAEVVEVPTYQTSPPPSVAILRRLVDQIINRHVDAVILLGEPATANLLSRADAEQRRGDLLNALCEDVLCACLGPLTARSLHAQGLEPLVAPEPYPEELARTVAAALPKRAVQISVNGSRLEIRGQAVLLDDRLIPVQAGPIAILRALARRPGGVLSCADIRRTVPAWSGADDHAIEMAVSRLRRSLDRNDLVQTVMKRGYRLAV